MNALAVNNFVFIRSSLPTTKDDIKLKLNPANLVYFDLSFSFSFSLFSYAISGHYEGNTIPAEAIRYAEIRNGQ
jgi:hypothetical protein